MTREEIDCISREQAKASIRDKFKDLPSRVEINTILNELPSVTLQESKWIPCSERLPEEIGTYMTTIDYGEHGLVTGQRYYYGKGLKWNDEYVIAWMPLPEPYKTESEE